MNSDSDRAINDLGGFMLRGWILTDKTCPNSSCKLPLLRSPKDGSHFCVNCDGNSEETEEANTSVGILPSSSTTGSSDSRISPSSTPPTEVSRIADSPTFELLPESEASIRRREQSDRASTEIGSRLLRGWAMLAEECPNDGCFGVPLVRPPGPSPGNKDPKMECVVCARVYTSETNSRGSTQIVPYSPIPQPSRPTLQTDTSASTLPNKTSVPAPPVSTVLQPPSNANAIESVPLAESGLDASTKALETTLMLLSKRLGAVHSDPHAIGLTADAITKTVQALTMVKQLQWSERQNSLSWP